MFITFEGVDGSGKTTQLRELRNHLNAMGHEVITTREPGGTPGAEEIRSLLVSGDPGRWSASTEILLFMAARLDHVERLVRPTLEAGKVVLCDRFIDSTRAYQGLRNPELLDQIEDLHRNMVRIDPDITILLDQDPQITLARSRSRGGIGAEEDRFESLGLAFQQDLRRAFLELAARMPERISVIDAQDSVPAVAGRVLQAVEARLLQSPGPDP